MQSLVSISLEYLRPNQREYLAYGNNVRYLVSISLEYLGRTNDGEVDGWQTNWWFQSLEYLRPNQLRRLALATNIPRSFNLS